MIKGIVIKNGKLRIILTGEDALDKEALKLADGARCKIVKDNLKVFEQSVADALVIEIEAIDTKV